MRLLQITASNTWRGHEQKIIYLYEAFKEYGFVEDQFIACIQDSAVHHEAIKKDMQVFPFEYKSEYSLKLAKKIANFVKKNRIDVVFIHNSKAHTLAVLSHLLYNNNVPLVLCRTLIKRVDTNFFRKWKYNYKGIKKIICVSHPVIDSLKPAVKNHNKFCVVGSVTDINKFTKQQKTGMLHDEFNIPKDHKIIGNIAEFTGFKDHKTWINTVAELVKRNTIKAKYILVGKGKLESEVRQQVTDLNLEEHIIFAGFRKDIPEILPEFDLFMFTSNNEPTGGVLLESYACRVPIVAAKAGGIPEVIVENKTGFLAEVGNPISFANKVEELIQSPKLQQEFTENGYQYLKDNFTKAVISNKMFNELKKIVAEFPANYN